MQVLTRGRFFKVLLALGCMQSFLLSVSGQATGSQCPSVDGAPGCVCDHPDGKIDLTSLSNSDGTPKWTNLKDPNDYTYTFNPCKSYSVGCDNVYLCQKDKSIDDTYYDIADDGTEKIYIDTDGKVYLYYTAPGSGRYTRVYLQCDESLTSDPQFVVEGDSGGTILHYVFYMKHAAACPGKAPPSPGEGGGGDVAGPVGLVLIFLMLGALVAYFIIGAVIMNVMFKKTGSDIIPHKGFWFALPFLIKDGFLFTFSPCVSAIKNRGYNKA